MPSKTRAEIDPLYIMCGTEILILQISTILFEQHHSMCMENLRCSAQLLCGYLDLNKKIELASTKLLVYMALRTLEKNSLTSQKLKKN